MSRIFLTTDPSALTLADLADVEASRALCVYAAGYATPLGVPAMPFADFEDRAREIIDELDALIVVGLNRLITPSTRTDHVWEVLFNLSPDLPKISIDSTLFVSQPWRIWFHFGFVGAPFAGYTYSYLAESHHTAFVERIRESDPFDLDEVRRWGAGVVQAVRPFVFDEPRVRVVPLPADVHERYAAEKEAAFAEEATSSAIIRRLARFAAEHCPERRIPQPHAIFRRRAVEIVRTDLRVDEHLTNELLHRVRLTNGIAEAFRP